MPRIAFALAVSLACLGAGAAHAAEQARTVPPFTAISVQGPFNVIVEAGKAQSLSVRGSDKFVGGVASDVVDGELVVRMRDRNYGTLRGDQHVVVTVPQLRAFKAEGAGEIRLNHIRGERFEVGYRGAGELRITGEVKAFRIRAEGVGVVDTKDLIADDVDIRFQGVGEARVYARNRLDAQVEGMGSLTYFGRPRVVNNKASGLGSVRQGDR
ncbi:head GIN domain-containing protein [uncultured Massilia sp.]|uniref:head GIN domain-containing protein n=1 Tax=uncultured Massilia sp. TaxID=169973 RepID=UPI0025D22F12|nr:head GIN domain-containing protein [uncultured Massilia sp.]